MARTEHAVARIRYLAGLSKTYRSTPSTLSGDQDRILSYRMPIAWKENGEWVVTDKPSTPTTNRHKNAARIALLS